MWQVTTETSVYLLDLDANLATRVPDAGAGPPDGMAALPIASLRRDHEQVPLIRLVCCTVSRPMCMMLDLRRDGVPTLRTTTTVRQLRALNGGGK
jgi:hypothetical protein